MKKMRKTKMRSKKNVRKTKRIRGGSGGGGRERSRSRERNQSSEKRSFFNMFRAKPDVLDKEFKRAMEDYEDAVIKAEKEHTTYTTDEKYVYKEGVKSDPDVISALEALHDIDMKIYQRNKFLPHERGVQPEQSKSHKKAKENFMVKMKDTTIFDHRFYPESYRDMHEAKTPDKSFGRRGSVWSEGP